MRLKRRRNNLKRRKKELSLIRNERSKFRSRNCYSKKCIGITVTDDQIGSKILIGMADDTPIFD